MRVPAIDVVRGLVMVIMALDHVRDMLSVARPGASFAAAGLALFLTRWVTHVCAPTFVLLAGAGAALSHAGGRPVGEVARFLATRGAWLVLLETTVVTLAWNFNLGPRTIVALGVLWAIGCSMIVLAGLVRLPLPAVAAIGAAMVAGHNLLDGIQPAPGDASLAWRVLHMQGPLVTPRGPVAFVVYPLVPWIGVMALGWVLGSLVARWDDARRRRRLAASGLAMLAAFVALRTPNLYGEPVAWARRATAAGTLASFLDVTKYPPSLHYLLVTLGAALLLLAVAEGRRGPLAGALATFGRVPLFYYVVHLYVIHAAALVVGIAQGFAVRDVAVPFFAYPPGFGVGLGTVYAAWLAIVAGLYPPCAWFAGLKRRRSDWWLRYA